MGGCGAEKGVVCAKDAFKGWGSSKESEVGETGGKGMDGGNRDGDCDVGGNDRVLPVGAPVFVAPVESGDSWDGSTGWQVGGFNPSFVGGDQFSLQGRAQQS